MSYKITYQKNGTLHTMRCDSLDSLPSNIIKIESKKNISFPNFSLKSNNKKEVLELFSQLNIMLKANLNLSEAIELSLKTKQSQKVKTILNEIKKSITHGKSLEKSLENYKNFLGEMPILFLQLGIENGNIKQSIDSLVTILSEDITASSKLQDTLRYPKLLMVSFLIALGMVFIYVIPNFEYIFLNLKGDIPLSTKVLLDIHYFVVEYFYVFIGIFLSAYFIWIFCYKRYRDFFDKLVIVSTPIISKVLKDYYFYRLFLLLSMIVQSKYQFQVAIYNSQKLIPNLYIQSLIQTILTQIKNGTTISEAFDKTKIFDDLTIKLLFTAENTTQYEQVLNDLTAYYRLRFQESLKSFIAYVEPTIILLIALVVLWLMMAIMLPIWSMSSLLS